MINYLVHIITASVFPVTAQDAAVLGIQNREQSPWSLLSENALLNDKQGYWIKPDNNV